MNDYYIWDGETLILVLGDKGVKVDTVGHKTVLLTFHLSLCAVLFLCAFMATEVKLGHAKIELIYLLLFYYLLQK